MSQLPATLTTAHLADACVRLGLGVLCPPLRPAFLGARVSGPLRSVVHLGSVDVILEALGRCPAGAVLLVDDDARLDRACIGDLIALEARHVGLSGIVVNGGHRDSDELASIGFGVFSLGAHPSGPLTVDASDGGRGVARIGAFDVSDDDWIVGDADGVILVPADRVDDVVRVASEIRSIERAQAACVVAGTSLREQLRFDEYVDRRTLDPSYGFREHLARIGRAIEQ